MPLDNPFEPMIKNIGNYVTGTLYSQGTIPPINIDNYDGLAVASPADTHLLAAKDPVINEIAVGMSGNLIGSNVVTGTPPLQLPNSAGYPLQWLNVELSPYQDLHGYANPWPAGGGKNLLDTSNAAPLTQYGVTFTPNSDGSITVNGIAEQNVNYFITNNVGINIPNGSYVISGCPSGGGSTTYRLRTDDAYGNVRGNDTGNGANFTIADGKLYAVFITIWSGTRCDNIVFRPQICLASAPNPTEYAPYSNICPIYGTDKLNIFVEESYDPAATPKAIITMPNTVYGGTVWSDGGEATWGNIASYNGETLPGEWISSMDVYSAGTTPTIGAQVVYELATPTQFSLTTPTIPTPRGTAYAWATAEDGTVDSMGAAYIQNE